MTMDPAAVAFTGKDGAASAWVAAAWVTTPRLEKAVAALKPRPRKALRLIMVPPRS
jgi:hypothetical protein